MHRITPTHLLSPNALRMPAGAAATVVGLRTKKAIIQMRGVLEQALPDRQPALIQRSMWRAYASYTRDDAIGGRQEGKELVERWLAYHDDVLLSDPVVSAISAWDVAQPFGDGFFMGGLLESNRHRPGVREAWFALVRDNPEPEESGQVSQCAQYFTPDEVRALGGHHSWLRADAAKALLAFKVAALSALTLGDEPSSTEVDVIIHSTVAQRLRYGAELYHRQASPSNEAAFLANAHMMRGLLTGGWGVALTEHATVEEVHAALPVLQRFLQQVSRRHPSWHAAIQQVAAEGWQGRHVQRLRECINQPHRVTLRGALPKAAWVAQQLCNYAAIEVIRHRITSEVSRVVQHVFGVPIEAVMWGQEDVWGLGSGTHDFAQRLLDGEIDVATFQLSPSDHLQPLRHAIMTTAEHDVRRRLAHVAMRSTNPVLVSEVIEIFANEIMRDAQWLYAPSLVSSILVRDDIAPEDEVMITVDPRRISMRVGEEKVMSLTIRFDKLKRWESLWRLHEGLLELRVNPGTVVSSELRATVRSLLGAELLVKP